MSCHSIELSSCLREPQFFIKMHKEGRSAMRRPSFAISPRRSADVIDPFLVRSFFRCFRLRRQLQHPGLLALAQQCQQNRSAVGKFQRIVVGSHFVLIDRRYHRTSVGSNFGAIVGCLCLGWRMGLGALAIARSDKRAEAILDIL